MEVREPNATYLQRPNRVLTSAGELPEDWIVQPLGELMRLLNGRAFRPDEWSDTGLPIIRIQNLNSADSDFNYFPGAVDEGNLVRPGDLLFAWSGTTGSSFGARVWAGAKGVLNQHIFKVIPDLRKLSPAFAYRLLLTAQYAIERQAHGFKASFVHVKKSDLVSVSAGFPPTLGEQNRIAEALEDADTLIDSLEKLLTKKRQIKQGAMQELLTGKRRLPGFEQRWNEVKLRQLGTFLKGSGIKREEALSGDLPCVRYGEIYTTHSDHVRSFSSWISPAVASSATLLRRGDLLFAGSGETKEEIGKCVAFLDEGPAYAGGDIVILRPTVDADSMFLGYLLNTPGVVRQKASKGQGDAVVHISANALGEVEVLLPESSVQTAIASVLFDTDVELAALESRLTKARALKQAMAQALLTGRIRLVEPTA